MNRAPSLRPYQAACVDRLRAAYAAGRRAPLLALPTGGGKTIVFSAIAAGAAAKGKRVLVLVHRRELVRQASAKLAEAGVAHGVIAAGFPAEPGAPVQVASVQSAGRRLGALGGFGLAVLDECHHCRAAQWRAVLVASGAAKLLGVTATPARLDGKGLGIAAGGIFDALVAGPGIAELMAAGFLSPARCFAPPGRLDLSGVRTRGGDYAIGDLEQAMAPSITGDAVAEYRQRADHLPALAFCISVRHAEAVAAAFREAGYRAKAVHGGLPVAERDAAISGLENGAIEVLASCDLISEGLDVSSVGAVILLRPTQSLVLHMQQIGRGLRPAPGKRALIVLDHAGNLFAHGLPEAKRQWSLDGRTRRVAEPAPAVRQCPECWACHAPALACPECGYVYPRQMPKREVVVRPGELAEITTREVDRYRAARVRDLVRGARSMDELRAIGRARGYHPKWAGRIAAIYRKPFAMAGRAAERVA